jgi:hypothetical protein
MLGHGVGDKSGERGKVGCVYVPPPSTTTMSKDLSKRGGEGRWISTRTSSSIGS